MNDNNEQPLEDWARDRAYLLGVLQRILESLIKYQRDDKATIFRESHKCRRLCEEALAKVR